MHETKASPQRSIWLCARLFFVLCCVTAAHCDAVADAGGLVVETHWLTPGLVYEATVLANAKGGIRRGTTYVGNLHFQLTAKGLSGRWEGSTAFLDVLNIHGGRPSQRVGDAQGVSNIEGPPGTQIEEVWIQHNVAGNTMSLLAGIYDVNSEFYRLQSAGLFVNSSFGIGPEFAQSGISGPSIFPRTSAGIRVDIKPASGWVIRAALLDGAPIVRPDGSRAAFRAGDGLLGVAEIAWRTQPQANGDVSRSGTDRIGRFSALSSYKNKFAVGAWRYTAPSNDLSDTDLAGIARLRRGTSGAYAIGEVALVSSNEPYARQLAMFVQAGMADAKTNRFSTYFGIGLIGSGWGLGRDGDQIGISVARAKNGAHYISSQQAQGIPTSRAETTFEMTYVAPLSKQLTVQPDLQYVRNPNTDPSVTNAWVLQVRFQYSF